MKNTIVLGSVLILATLASANVEAASVNAVIPSQRRVETLRLADKLLAPRETHWRDFVADVSDPFYRKDVDLGPAKSDGVQVAVATQPEHSDEDILKSVAPEIAPTGTMLIGAEPYLLVSGRRFRVGDQISVTFDGLVYRVAITSIERNSYTLRLNDYELRRDFK